MDDELRKVLESQLKDKQPEAKEHDFKVSELGLSTCKNCGCHKTLPQWPRECKPQQPESLGQSDACFDGNHKNCGWHCNCECHTTSSPNPQQPEKCEHEWKNDGQQHSKLWCIKCGLVHGAGVEDYYDKRLIKSHKPKQKIAKFDKNFYWDIHDEVRDKINEIIDFFNLDIKE